MLWWIELLAVLSSGVFGVLLARRKQLDFVGVFSVAFVVTFGGGTLRDVLLDRRPLFWIENDHYVKILFGLSLVASLIRRWPVGWEKWLHFPDALGLGLFSIAGTSHALMAGTSPFIAALLGVITGTCGGVIGDIVCNEVPHLFRPTAPLYATCSFVGVWVFQLLAMAHVHTNVAIWSGVATTVVMRLVALRFDLKLPATKSPEERDADERNRNVSD